MNRLTSNLITVAIANGTLVTMAALRQVIETHPAYELIWWAKDGEQAVALCECDPPDLMLMDVQMPGLDGVEATRQIMAKSPCAILIVTEHVLSHTSKIFEAMGHGALDVVGTPVLAGHSDGGGMTAASTAASPLLAKMATMSAFIGKSVRRNQRHQTAVRSLSVPRSLPPLTVIGASTGGPKALATILCKFPASLPAAIVIVQHIDSQFSVGLANWLNTQTALGVRVAKSGDRLLSGQVYVAGSDQHLVMKRDLTLDYSEPQTRTPYRPSIDVFFKGVSQYWPHPGQAVLLTGMGCDGADGLAVLRSAGWQTIAESQESCVVYGMPRAAIDKGAASQILAVQDISAALIQGISTRRIPT